MEVGRTIVKKWKPFFESLEELHGLRVDSAGHIWLLHHLFLNTLNGDIQRWAEHWNAHVMRLKGVKNMAPRDMFLVGLSKRLAVINVGGQDENIGDVAQFGIDWEGLEDEDLIRELQERGEENPFDNYAPDRLNEVPCEPPHCPLTRDQVDGLDAFLQTQFNMQSNNVDEKTGIWTRALMWCRDLF